MLAEALRAIYDLDTAVRLMKAPILLAFLATAQAAEPTGTLTLACNGTTTVTMHPNGPETEPISTRIVINFMTGKIDFPGVWWLPVKISVNNTTISFYGDNMDKPAEVDAIYGTIDRITGKVEATHVNRVARTRMEYALTCKPQRMF